MSLRKSHVVQGISSIGLVIFIMRHKRKREREWERERLREREREREREWKMNLKKRCTYVLSQIKLLVDNTGVLEEKFSENVQNSISIKASCCLPFSPEQNTEQYTCFFFPLT